MIDSRRGECIIFTKAEVAKFIVGLIEVNDAELIDDDRLLTPQICAADDRATLRQLRDLMVELTRQFDFTVTPKFNGMIAERSDAYRLAMVRRYSDPEKRTVLGIRSLARPETSWTNSP